MMLQFFPENSKHQKMILERMVGRLESRIKAEGISTGDNDNADKGSLEENLN